MAVRKSKTNPLSMKYKNDIAAAQDRLVHIYHKGAVCETDTRGHATPNDRSPAELVVDATDGVIPLWDQDVTLRWRFQERSMASFRNPEGAKAYLRDLLAQGVMLWKESPPVKFREVRENWDFEIVVSNEEKCTPNGCTLARAFFPDAGRHELVLYPTLFTVSFKEQVETMAHEIGHIFGLRHFFAEIRERRWKSETFGKHSPFSIMNYGDKSKMTKHDVADLTKLYQMVWSGDLTHINGTKVKLFRPFSFAAGQLTHFDLAAMQQ